MDLAETDGFGAVVGNVFQRGDLLDGAAIEHRPGAQRDAGVEIGAGALDDEAAELR